MSECRYFWTNLNKAVEVGPVCPSTGAVAVFQVAPTQYLVQTDDVVFTLASAPNGDAGYDYLTPQGDLFVVGGTAGWLDLTTIPGIGVLLTPVSSGGGG